jgi:hypothetical protein
VYTLITYVPGKPMIVPGLTLGDAWRMIRDIGRGAIYRGYPRPRDLPVYPSIQPKGRAA